MPHCWKSHVAAQLVYKAFIWEVLPPIKPKLTATNGDMGVRGGCGDCVMLVDGDVGDELGALLAVDDDGMLKLKWIISTTH